MIPSVAQLSADKYNFILAVGDSGAGKTCAMSSWPGKTLVHDWDGRIRGLWGNPAYSEEDLKRVSVIQYKAGSGFAEAEKQLDILEAQLNKGVCPYKNQVLDSVSSLGDELLSDGMKFTEGERKLGSLEITTIQDYLYESIAFKQLLFEGVKWWPCNTFVTAHIIPKYGKAPGKDNKYSDSVIIGEKILARDKISAKLPTYFDNVWEFRKDATYVPARYVCHFRNTSLSRTTFRNLPDKIDWTYIPGKQEKKFYDLIAEFLPRVKETA